MKLYAPYANTDSIKPIEKDISAYEEVKEIFYQESLLQLVNENIRKISLIILVFSTMLFLIAIALINNTIRLSIYSRRFLINTMKLVGATKPFIRRPFLYKSARHGIIAAFIALGLLGAILYFIQHEFYDFIYFRDMEIMGILVLFVLALGASLNWISTFFAVNKYLRMNTDDLYY